jgi:PAS domain-containing protein
MGVSIVKSQGWVGAFRVHSATPHAWTAAERELLREMAERTWSALELASLEAARREAGARYSALFEESPVPTILTRARDQVIVNANAAFLRLFGFDRNDVIGKTSFALGIVTGDGNTAEPIFLGGARDVRFRAGVQAVQSTPLFSRSGAPLGVISTHYLFDRFW